MSDASDNSGLSLFERIGFALLGAPLGREQLLAQLRDAKQRDVLDGDTLAMIEGVFRIKELQVRDLMVPRSRMIVLRREDAFDEMLATVIESAYSRFPVIGNDRDEVVGILVAKDLFGYTRPADTASFRLTDVLRPAVFVPESKRLNALLWEFRTNRNHMAIVVDEYGGVAGLITIEDVIEQIVGEIGDEHDFDAEREFIEQLDGAVFRVDGITPIEEFHRYFDVNLDEDDFETIGGLVANKAGHVPKVGEEFELSGFRFRVEVTDSRRINELRVQRLPDPEQATEGALAAPVHEPE